MGYNIYETEFYDIIKMYDKIIHLNDTKIDEVQGCRELTLLALNVAVESNDTKAFEKFDNIYIMFTNEYNNLVIERDTLISIYAKMKYPSINDND